MSCHPHPEREAERLETLMATGTLNEQYIPALDALVESASKIFCTPIAALSLVDADRQFFKAHKGLAVRQTSRDVSFCTHTIGQAGPLVVLNALEDVRFADNPLVLDDPKIRFYAGVPVNVRDLPIASLCVIDQEPRESFSSKSLMMLDIMAQKASEILSRRLN